ncbi:MAG: hypothetical protein ACRD2U_10890 [Terriglobales bacterium]
MNREFGSERFKIVLRSQFAEISSQAVLQINPNYSDAADVKKQLAQLKS